MCGIAGLLGLDGSAPDRDALEAMSAALVHRGPDDAGTHVDYRVWFEGHGIGKLIRVMAGRGARSEMPASLALLKQRLELVDA